jgi:hypothetical protein
MIKETEQKDSSSVDKGLVAMFLRMSPDERLLANDNMVRTIIELRNAYKQRLVVLEETLRQVNEEDGIDPESGNGLAITGFPHLRKLPDS